MISSTKISLVGFLFLAIGLALPNSALSKDLPPPDEQGPYNVGIRTFDNVPMSGGRLTRVQVYYPTLEPENCQTEYTVQGVGGTYQRSSPLCAVQNASIAPGPHKLIVHDHGGGAGPDRPLPPTT